MIAKRHEAEILSRTPFRAPAPPVEILDKVSASCPPFIMTSKGLWGRAVESIHLNAQITYDISEFHLRAGRPFAPKEWLLRDRLILIGTMLALGAGAFLWFGGAGLLIVGILATLFCAGGLGGNYAMNPTEGTWNPVGTERVQRGWSSKKTAFVWGLVVALLLAATGLYLFEAPGPLP